MPVGWHIHFKKCPMKPQALMQGHQGAITDKIMSAR